MQTPSLKHIKNKARLCQAYLEKAQEFTKETSNFTDDISNVCGAWEGETWRGDAGRVLG